MGTSSAERRANADGFASRAGSGALNAAGPQKGLCDASEVIDSESKNSGEDRADELHGKSVRGEPGDDDVPESTRVDVREIGRAQSELQSRGHLVCRLLLEKKKQPS